MVITTFSLIDVSFIHSMRPWPQLTPSLLLMQPIKYMNVRSICNRSSPNVRDACMIFHFYSVSVLSDLQSQYTLKTITFTHGQAT